MSGKKILVVDDAASNRMVIRALLSQVGHEVTVADGVDSAIEAFSCERFDAVLTDLRMPDGEEGVTLARKLRGIPGGERVRIAVMSGDVDAEITYKGVFDATIGKPVLLEDIQRFLVEE